MKKVCPFFLENEKYVPFFLLGDAALFLKYGLPLNWLSLNHWKIRRDASSNDLATSSVLFPDT